MIIQHLIKNTLGFFKVIEITISREEISFDNTVNGLATEILKSELKLAFLLITLVDSLLSSSTETLTNIMSLQIKETHKNYRTHSTLQSITSFLNFLRNSLHYVFTINLI